MLSLGFLLLSWTKDNSESVSELSDDESSGLSLFTWALIFSLFWVLWNWMESSWLMSFDGLIVFERIDCSTVLGDCNIDSADNIWFLSLDAEGHLNWYDESILVLGVFTAGAV